jgi:hypothetical protein
MASLYLTVSFPALRIRLICALVAFTGFAGGWMIGRVTGGVRIVVADPSFGLAMRVGGTA